MEPRRGLEVWHPFVRHISPQRSFVPASGMLAHIAQRATRAPSIHNTQPWHFALTGDALEIRADRSRQLTVLDPRGRQLTISCGCALYTARVAIAAAGFEPFVHRFPNPDRPDVFARVQIGRPRHSPDSMALERAIDDRRTNRRAFIGDPVPAWLIREVQGAASAEGSVLVPVTAPDHRAALTWLSALADDMERADPRYLAELAAWTTDDPRRPDGVQAASMPYAGELAGQRDPLPIRGFDVRGIGWLPARSASGQDESLLLFCSNDDQPAGWLRTGEALQHVWLKLTEHGFQASPLTQVVEVRETNKQLRDALELTTEPQLLLRVGQAPTTVTTHRRASADVIVVDQG